MTNYEMYEKMNEVFKNVICINIKTREQWININDLPVEIANDDEYFYIYEEG